MVLIDRVLECGSSPVKCAFNFTVENAQTESGVVDTGLITNA